MRPHLSLMPRLPLQARLSINRLQWGVSALVICLALSDSQAQEICGTPSLYTIVTAMGEALSIYAQGEVVEKVRLSTTVNGSTLATLITVSGKEFAVPHAALAMIGG